MFFSFHDSYLLLLSLELWFVLIVPFGYLQQTKKSHPFSLDQMYLHFMYLILKTNLNIYLKA